jgi:FGGY-family pentulose kinase
LARNDINPNSIKGIGFDATCSLAVFKYGTDQPVTITGKTFANDGNDRNVILWLDHRPVKETELINSTKHNILRYFGGSVSIEMEIPKILWLKINMPPDMFSSCSFFDLVDALTFLATGNTARSFCSTVCKQGFMPIGVGGSTTGWQEDFLQNIGLGELCEGDFEKLGGIDGKVYSMVPSEKYLVR